jgi:hypothetical protein
MRFEWEEEFTERKETIRLNSARLTTNAKGNFIIR